ncbi:sulfite exporter TauE/SafE family protein [Salinispira pacifica]
MSGSILFRRGALLVLLLFLCAPLFAEAAGGTTPVAADGTASVAADGGLAWWVWALILFGLSFVLGIAAILAGVGGGSLYVPIVSAFFPFHIDFIRGAGLLIALTGSLSAGPHLIRERIGSLRLALPFGLAGAAFSVVGAFFGLALPGNVVQAALGITMLAIVLLMVLTSRSDFPLVQEPDALGQTLGMAGAYHEPALGRKVSWNIHRTPAGFLLFMVIGFMSGMFGLGAGWANIPVLNLVLGVPLKIAVGTSSLILSVNASAASWVYLHSGAVLGLITVPSVLGMTLGTRLGARVLGKARLTVVRWSVVALLAFAGIRSLLKGFGVWP